MLKVSNIEVFNFENALRGMRNPKDSWEKSDSKFCQFNHDDGCYDCQHEKACLTNMKYIIGPNDMKLAQQLIAGGPVHSKFLRQIFVTINIDAPLYWWKEMDTYKVGTVANSCSTMHKIHSYPITMDNFSLDNDATFDIDRNEIITAYVDLLEELRQEFNETGDREIWRMLIQLAPESWNQMRTWTADYEVLRSIRKWRKEHKLTEWHTFCDVIDSLPYAKELINYEL